MAAGILRFITVNLKVLAMQIEAQGYQVMTASSGEEALRTLENHPVAVIITDQRMAGMNGVELLSIVQERFGCPATLHCHSRVD